MISEMMKSSIPRKAGSIARGAVGLGRAVVVVVGALGVAERDGGGFH